MSHPWVTGKTASSELIDEDVFLRLQNFNARRKFRATAYASIVRTKFQLRNKYLKELLGDRVLTAAELENLRVTFQRMYVVGPLFFEVPFLLVVQEASFIPCPWFSIAGGFGALIVPSNCHMVKRFKCCSNFTPTAHHTEGPVLVATCSLAGDKCTTSTQLTTRVWCLKRSPLAGNSHQENPGSCGT